jgi:predicted Na+-dependent transporter
LKEKTKLRLEKIIRPTLKKASLGQLSDEFIEKWVQGYIKFLNWMTKVTASISIMVSFAWFFPIYVGLGYERTILIVLLIILLHLRFGTTDIKLKE